MQTLILPGYSEHNKTWVDEVAKNLKFNGIIRPFYWAHWTDETNKFDAKEKANLIAKHIKGDNINIIAKSLGTLVASYLYLLIPNQIEKIIFCGIPLTSLNDDELEVIKSCISKNDQKFLGFQNVGDPHGNFEEVKDFGNILMRSRDDHEYPYFDEFNNFLTP
jgi:pimeloyl-ACP methyl ester carboxylesterase